MGKIFKISGNFTQDGEWADDVSAFSGKIVANDAGKFYGWCNQCRVEGSAFYDESEICETSKIRYLIGALAKEGSGYSLAFFKLSNSPFQTPLFYETHDVSAADSTWSAKDPGGGFLLEGNAKASLEEIPYSENEAKDIKTIFDRVDLGLGDNLLLVQEVTSWQKKALVLWA